MSVVERLARKRTSQTSAQGLNRSNDPLPEPRRSTGAAMPASDGESLEQNQHPLLGQDRCWPKRSPASARLIDTGEPAPPHLRGDLAQHVRRTRP